MKALIYDASFPTMPAQTEALCAAINRDGEIPDGDNSIEAKMCYVMYLLKRKRFADAGLLIDTLNYAPSEGDMPLTYRAWLWLSRMGIYLTKKDYMMAADAAEQSLRVLDVVTVKRGENFLAILAGLLYNLASMHHAIGENVRAAKELGKAQKLYERLVKKNQRRFATMLTYAVEASTIVFSSRTKQLEVLAHYQEFSEQFSALASEGNREALASMMNTLTKEGDIMMQMGNSRDAVKYYTKALRCHKRLGGAMTKDALRISIALARAMMRKPERREKAVQLLTTLQPVAQRMGEKEAEQEIDDLLNAKDKNFSIMSLLKGIF